MSAPATGDQIPATHADILWLEQVLSQQLDDAVSRLSSRQPITLDSLAAELRSLHARLDRLESRQPPAA